MKIVILAGGKGKRMGTLTEEIPKPLLKLNGVTLLENKLNSLPKNTSEIIITIGYLGEKIKSLIGESYNKIPVKYVEQTELLGTAHALWQCRELLDSPFIVLMSDDIYDQTDLQKLSDLEHDQWAVLAYPENSESKVGKMGIDQNGNLIGIYESPANSTDYNLTYTGACRLTPEIFKEEMIKIGKGEYGLPQTFCQFLPERSIKIIETKNWKRITSPEDLN